MNYADLLITIRTFREDIGLCTQQSSTVSPNQQFWRRAYVRTTFAFIEGMTFGIKQFTFGVAKKAGVRLLEAEKALLAEEDYDLDDKGEVTTASAKISITRNVRFAFKILGRAGAFSYELKVDDEGWDSFKKSIKIRDRLMHPKRSEDLAISDQELETVKKASAWFLDSLESCLDKLSAQSFMSG
jgi:hypothetical protein